MKLYTWPTLPVVSRKEITVNVPETSGDYSALRKRFIPREGKLALKPTRPLAITTNWLEIRDRRHKVAPRTAALRLVGQTIVEPAQKALRFPSNVSGSDTAAPYVAIKFANPQNDGYPVWGPSDSGVTMIRRIKVHQQTGYYAQWWWCQDDGNFSFTGADDHPNYGCHPYPTTADSTGTSHVWELASQAGDFFNSAGSGDVGQGTAATKDTWYTQALRVTVNGDSTKTIRFWYDVINDSATYIERGFDAAYGSSLAAIDFAVIIGDSPWYATNQHERASMDLASIKIIMDSLSDSDVASEAGNMGQLVTAAAQSAIWWGKTGFDSVDDLTCDYSTGRAFAWTDASNKGEVV